MAEAAGIALAVFPLVIKGLSAYSDFLETVKKLREYRKTLRDFIRKLVTEEELLRISLGTVLLGYTDAAGVEALLAEPGGVLWREEHIQDSLQALLGSSFDVFIRAIEGIKENLEELREKVGVDAENDAKWVMESFHKRQWKKVRFNQREGAIEKLFQRIDKDNRDIEKLVARDKRLGGLRPSKRSVSVKTYERIRDHAKSIYSVLKHKLSWPCGCAVPHSASLHLEYRNGIKMAPIGHDRGLHFKILFTFEATQEGGLPEPPWGWREARIEPLEVSSLCGKVNSSRNTFIESATSVTASASVSRDSAAMIATAGFSIAAIGGCGGMAGLETEDQLPIPTITLKRSSVFPVRPKKVSFAPTDSTLSKNQSSRYESHVSERTVSELPEIEDLCKAISCQTTSYLGIIADESDKRHRVSITAASSDKELMQTISLLDVLAQSSVGRKERLVLGLKLASTLLQLYDTPWLTETWGKHDIRFKRQQNRTALGMIEHPLFSKDFGPQDCQNSSSPERVSTRSPLVRYPSLFRLGTVLIELWFGKSIENLRLSSELGPDNLPNMITDIETTQRLTTILYDEAGISFGDAVRRCIRGDFNIRDESLTADSLKEAVHDGVVKPLEENVQFLYGDTLENIMN